MNTMETGCSGAGKIIVLVCLILIRSFFAASAQTTLDQQAVAALFQAIDDNNTNAVQELYAHNTNVVDDRYYRAIYSRHNPLLQAAADGRTGIVALLLKYGVDPNVWGDTRMSANAQMTALDEAARSGRVEICELLLKAGANPNHRAFSQNTALHFIFDDSRSNTNRDKIAGLLLDYGADPFLEAGYYKTTPIELAITHDDRKLVPRMLGQDLQHPLGNKSLIKSTSRKHPRQPVKTSTDFLAERGVALLAAAARRGELEAVQALLKAGVSAKGNTEDGTPLIQVLAVAGAAAGKNIFDSARWLQIRDLLIKKGADYNAFAATALGDIEQARQLSSADKNLAQATEKDGQTPLHWAVQNNQLLMTAFWLHAGASPAATNHAGQTALHIAAGKNLVGHMKLLLAAHAPTDVRDTNGWTPLDAATHAQQTEAIRLLLSDKSVVPPADRAIATSLHDTATGGNLAALVALTEATNNLEARNELGLTPLQVAVLNGHLGEAALLVDWGANVNVRDSDGKTLLHQILLQEKQLIVHDRPPTNWLERMGQDPRKSTYVKYLTVGQYEPGPNPVLQAASFLLACGVDAKATNHAGQTAVQLVTDEKTSRSIFFFDDDRATLLKLLGTGGGNVNQGDANGDTALHRSGQDLTADRVAALIASGADVNATNHLGRTPLHNYAKKIYGWDLGDGSNEPFQLLLKSKPNVNAQDNEGLTPLHVLATADTSFRKEATKLLLDAGADPNLRDKHGRTPAHLFLSGKWPWSEASECIDMLAKAGADLSAADNNGQTPLHYLAALGSQSPLFFIRGMGDIFIAAKVDFQARDNDGNTPLLIAAKTGTHDVFGWLVKQGANLDATNNAGETPRALAAHSKNPFSHFGPPDAETDIFQAVRDGKIDSATRLLRADAQLANETNQLGQTPLRLAVMMHRTNTVEFLETHGAKWDEVSAVMAGRADALQEILQRRPAAVSSTAIGQGLAHIAAANSDVDILKMLIAANCDLQSQDSWGLSPLGYALIKKRIDIEDLLLQHGAKEKIFDAVYAGDLKTVSVLLAQDKSLAKSQNKMNASAVEVAAAAGQADILKLLLKNGAPVDPAGSVDKRNPFGGRNPLHLAAFYNQTNALEILIRAGADVNLTDRRGFTALHWAAMQGAIEAAVWLIKHKADANKATAHVDTSRSLFRGPDRTVLGETPLHLAVLCGETNMVQLLLKSGADVNAVNGMLQTPLDLADSLPPMNFFSVQRICWFCWNHSASTKRQRTRSERGARGRKPQLL